MAAVMILVALEITDLLAGDTQQFPGFQATAAALTSYWHMHMRRIVCVAAARSSDYIKLSDSIDPQASH
jgi:hypothetical protein